jgi:hypothetical protein
LAGVLGGGIAPLIATKLLSIGGGNPYLIMLYIGSMAIVAIIATSFMPRDKYYSSQHVHSVEKRLDMDAKVTEPS